MIEAVLWLRNLLSIYCFDSSSLLWSALLLAYLAYREVSWLDDFRFCCLLVMMWSLCTWNFFNIFHLLIQRLVKGGFVKHDQVEGWYCKVSPLTLESIGQMVMEKENLCVGDDE